MTKRPEYDRFLKIINDNGGLPIDNDVLAAEAVKDALPEVEDEWDPFEED